MSEFYEGLAEIFEVEPDEINSDYALTDDNWDSLAIVSTIALIDDVHDITVRPEKLADCKTVGDIEQLVVTEQEA